MSKTRAIRTMTIAEYEQSRDEYDGVCLACGAFKWGECEPDARDYPCDDCGKNRVYGIEEALMMGLIDLYDPADQESQP